MLQIVVGLSAIMTASAFIGVQTTTRKSQTVVMAGEKSKSLPFLPQPPNIVGMAGDVGKIQHIASRQSYRTLIACHTRIPNHSEVI